jgi:glycosyltransferase involved in cell wall biosynthesis
MIKVAISYRVLQAWRVPIFERISNIDEVEIKVFYGEDFEGTKVVSYNGATNFPAVKLKTKKIRFKTSNGNAYVPFSMGLYSELRSFSPDVILTEGASNFASNLICFLYAKLNGVAIIQWGLGEIDGRKRSLHRRFLDLVFRWVERKSDAAIAYSSFGASYYKKIGLSPEQVFVAVNVVDTESRFNNFSRYCAQKCLQLPSPVPVHFNILFVGALAENKKVENIILAMARLKELDVGCTVVGEGASRVGLEKLALELGLQERVSFVGHVSQDVGGFFYNASIFVLPGLGGLAVSDALVHGVPVLCSIGDGCEKDLIEDGLNGYILPDMSVDDIEFTIRDLYSNPEKLELLRVGASRFIQGNYTVSEYVDNIKKAIFYVCR